MKQDETPGCTYCIDGPVETRDHVLPRSLFPLPKPLNLITVPSCLKCHRGFKKDEEYFLGIITFSQAGISAVGKRLWDQRLPRTYRKDRGLRKAIARAIVPKQVFTPAGLYLGGRLEVEPNWSRIETFFNKVVRGLYYHEYEEPLPVSTQIRYAMLGGPEVEEICRSVSPEKKGWNGVFEYRRSRLPNRFGDSLWLFLIYDTLLFGAATYQVKREDHPRNRR